MYTYIYILLYRWQSPVTYSFPSPPVRGIVSDFSCFSASYFKWQQNQNALSTKIIAFYVVYIYLKQSIDTGAFCAMCTQFDTGAFCAMCTQVDAQFHD